MDKVEHFEIPADDRERAIRFYTEVFGWELNPVPGVEYTRLLTKRVTERDHGPRPFEVNGAIVERNGVTRVPLITISVDDLNGTIQKINNHGGKIVQAKTPFGDRGYTAYFQDTEGNVLGLWQINQSRKT